MKGRIFRRKIHLAQAISGLRLNSTNWFAGLNSVVRGLRVGRGVVFNGGRRWLRRLGLPLAGFVPQQRRTP